VNVVGETAGQASSIRVRLAKLGEEFVGREAVVQMVCVEAEGNKVLARGTVSVSNGD